MTDLGRCANAVVRRWDAAVDGKDCVMDVRPAFGKPEMKQYAFMDNQPVQYVSKDELTRMANGQNVLAYYRNGKIAVGNYFDDETTASLAAHEAGHKEIERLGYKLPENEEQAKASEIGTYMLMNCAMHAKAEKAKAVDFMGRTYSMDAMERAVNRSKEMGRKFPGFRMN